MMLLILTQSPFVKALPPPNEHSTIILTQDAVIAASIPLPQPGYSKIYALADDVTARGLTTQLIEGIEIINYQQFVELTLTHHPIVSW